MSVPSGSEWVGLRRRVLGLCYQLLGSPFDAEEATQDTMERVWAARNRFDPTRGSRDDHGRGPPRDRPDQQALITVA